MDAKLFIVGRPGSGKTTVANLIRQEFRRRRVVHLNYFAINDFSTLQDLFELEQEKLLEQQKLASEAYPGFDIHDFQTFDIALRKMEEEVKKACSNSHRRTSFQIGTVSASLDYEKKSELPAPEYAKIILSRHGVSTKANSQNHSNVIPNKWKHKIPNVIFFSTFIPAKNAEEYLAFIRRSIAILKKILIRLQYANRWIRSGDALNPTPHKIEPPVGGVKIGGEQHDEKSHVARTLYQIQILKPAA